MALCVRAGRRSLSTSFGSGFAEKLEETPSTATRTDTTLGWTVIIFLLNIRGTLHVPCPVSKFF